MQTGLVSDASGCLTIDFTWPEGVPEGFAAYYQLAPTVGDTATTVSNTLSGTVPVTPEP